MMLRSFFRGGGQRWLTQTTCWGSTTRSYRLRETENGRAFSSSLRRTDKQHKLVIVGGGPSGLFLAALLQRYGFHDFLLLEQTPLSQQFRHPQAHFLNTRTMEILRHYTPSIYKQVLCQMPPVSEWQDFQFGASMISPSLARVRHPVHRPLMAGVDANAQLIDVSTETASHGHSESDHDSMIPLSDCSVGHLAQHTFQKILYEHVESGNGGQLKYGMRVVGAERRMDGVWTIHSDKGETFQTPLVVAADGARSQWRQEYCGGIVMQGQPELQNLINVHFTVDQNHSDRIPPAMLYTVFSPKILAMLVRHSATDFVAQIPFFPPHQSVDQDFGESQVSEMIRAALGRADIAFRICSVRPWTMGSLVAESFGKNGVYLVGDAAHVFPPAGGFGMNTGLQDALNLAWRLALGVAPSEEAYSRERRHVAQSNAALSVRNYHRVLGVMKACYLHESNLPILLKTLKASGLPQSWQRAAFQNLLSAALIPLGVLADPSNPYTRHVKRNLQNLLGSGQGLPLLFPGHELQFEYPSTEVREDDNGKSPNQDWTQDSLAGRPKLKIGSLFPHIPCYVVTDEGRSTKIGTTRDIATTLKESCSFVLARIQTSGSMDEGSDWEVVDQFRVRGSVIVRVDILVEEDNNIEHFPSVSQTKRQTLISARSEWGKRQLPVEPRWVLIRPDGHVAGTFSHMIQPKDLQEQVRASIEHACGAC